MKTTEEMMEMLKKFVRKGNLTRANHATFRTRATNRTGWSMKEVDAWLATKAEAVARAHKMVWRKLNGMTD